MSRPYAEKCSYWKTSKSSADDWHEKTTALIEKFGGIVTSSGFGSSGGKQAYMIEFEFEGDQYKTIWPALESELGDQKSARKQAATMLYHDTKAKLISAQALGFKTAMFQWYRVPDGRSAFELADQELISHVPQLLIASDREID